MRRCIEGSCLLRSRRRRPEVKAAAFGDHNPSARAHRPPNGKWNVQVTLSYPMCSPHPRRLAACVGTWARRFGPSQVSGCPRAPTLRRDAVGAADDVNATVRRSSPAVRPCPSTRRSFRHGDPPSSTQGPRPSPRDQYGPSQRRRRRSSAGRRLEVRSGSDDSDGVPGSRLM